MLDKEPEIKRRRVLCFICLLSMLITITGCANNISKNKENQAEISEPDIPVHISKEVIDVEGMEEKVLRGGIGTIVRNNYPPILFECWEIGWNNMTQEKRDSMEKFLTNLGYEIIWGWGDEETHLAIHN